MKYCIDYRNGSMGNTVLAHILYSCQQTDFDLNTFFSADGNAHRISKYNNTMLVAKHLKEYPDSNVKCVLEIYCNDWANLLKTKMSYSKWVHDKPTLHNFKKFNFNFDEKWQDPLNITQTDFVELLTKTYYDSFCNQQRMFELVPGIGLDQYLNGDFSELIRLSENVLEWKWDRQRSQIFFNKVLETNKKYLDWLKNIRSAVGALLDNNTFSTDFELWEQAIIIAKACTITDQEPMYINWQNSDCDMSIKNVYLKQFKKELSWQNRLT